MHDIWEAGIAATPRPIVNGLMETLEAMPKGWRVIEEGAGGLLLVAYFDVRGLPYCYSGSLNDIYACIYLTFRCILQKASGST